MKLVINVKNSTLEIIPQKSDKNFSILEQELKLARMLSMTLVTLAEQRFDHYSVKRNYIESICEEALTILEIENRESMTKTDKLISMIFGPNSIDDDAGYGNNCTDDNDYDDMF